MQHAPTKSDPAHRALHAAIPLEDPDWNNFRSDQPAPGEAPSADTWILRTDEQWLWYFREYDRYQRMPHQSQQSAGRFTISLVTRIDQRLSRRTIRVNRDALIEARTLRWEQSYYDLWDEALAAMAAEDHFYASWDYARGLTTTKPPFPPPPFL